MSHVFAHIIIFLAYLGATIYVPGVMRSLFYVRPLTLIAGGGFFLFCGLTHLALALDKQDALLFEITDHLQAVAIVAFLILIAIDLTTALRRLRQAFKLIHDEQGEGGDRAISLVTMALQRR
jgi:hypothetical protein